MMEICSMIANPTRAFTGAVEEYNISSLNEVQKHLIFLQNKLFQII